MLCCLLNLWGKSLNITMVPNEPCWSHTPYKIPFLELKPGPVHTPVQMLPYLQNAGGGVGGVEARKQPEPGDGFLCLSFN